MEETLGKRLLQNTDSIYWKKKEAQPKFTIQNNVPWIEVAKDVPYFITDTGESWTPIGQNDAITWPDLQGTFRRKDLPAVEGHLRWLAAHGVTCLRLMLEYCHGENRYFEKPVGRFVPNMIQLWDDIFALCEKYGLRILLTPYDTFWMWKRWGKHPYKKSNGGICTKRNQWLTCANTRQAIKQRLAFATERWGGSGTLFAWDLWNEIHPAHGGNDVAHFNVFIEDISTFLRETELRIHGRSHLQTVSLFSPVLEKNPEAADAIFRHPKLDFASTHFYEKGTIDQPKNTVDAAIATGRLTREALTHIQNNRPFFDSEHGPITSYKSRGRNLPEHFDDEYFRHMQWAHFASGGVGGGLRWPYRQPHVLTHGMRRAQLALSGFLPLINWSGFHRKNLNKEIIVSEKGVKAFACGDEKQAIVWLLRTDTIKKKMLNQQAKAIAVKVKIPGLEKGYYNMIMWDTVSGTTVKDVEVIHDSRLFLELIVTSVVTDMAIAIKITEQKL